MSNHGNEHQTNPEQKREGRANDGEGSLPEDKDASAPSHAPAKENVGWGVEIVSRVQALESSDYLFDQIPRSWLLHIRKGDSPDWKSINLLAFLMSRYRSKWFSGDLVNLRKEMMATYFGVSKKTIQRRLRTLEKHELIKRIHKSVKAKRGIDLHNVLHIWLNMDEIERITYRTKLHLFTGELTPVGRSVQRGVDSCVQTNTKTSYSKKESKEDGETQPDYDEHLDADSQQDARENTMHSGQQKGWSGEDCMTPRHPQGEEATAQGAGKASPSPTMSSSQSGQGEGNTPGGEGRGRQGAAPQSESERDSGACSASETDVEQEDSSAPMADDEALIRYQEALADEMEQNHQERQRAGRLHGTLRRTNVERFKRMGESADTDKERHDQKVVALAFTLRDVCQLEDRAAFGMANDIFRSYFQFDEQVTEAFLELLMEANKRCELSRSDVNDFAYLHGSRVGLIQDDGYTPSYPVLMLHGQLANRRRAA